MRSDWITALWRILAVLDAKTGAAPHRFARFEIGFCRSCRRLRSVSSLRCRHCDSTRPVSADA